MKRQDTLASQSVVSCINQVEHNIRLIQETECAVLLRIIRHRYYVTTDGIMPAMFGEFHLAVSEYEKRIREYQKETRPCP